MSSTLTFGQFIKAIASFVAPILAAWAVVRFLNWRMIMFPVFLAVCLCVLAWLFFTKIEEKNVETRVASFAECFSLLGDRTILLLFLGIMAHVGLDVGINTTAPKLLMERLHIDLADAGYATSFYFIFRTAGCLLGSGLLAKFSAKKVFIVSASMILIGILCLGHVCWASVCEAQVLRFLDLAIRISSQLSFRRLFYKSPFLKTRFQD